jgi:hypothetical protein
MADAPLEAAEAATAARRRTAQVLIERMAGQIDRRWWIVMRAVRGGLFSWLRGVDGWMGGSINEMIGRR